ncbi:Response regulator rcp1 [Emticicia aquatica]|jgi:CheY-like chemotaxis protein|uniref:Response regulator rcp1 n=1 Tax=Emticicia aquatica TaxID=1681835 RepID=A0ABN8ESL7_9BACT|nr:response regulator [Emticicia aquatica]CAH0994808.1 Response regulator rcp1 [Emticicia aquatica]
MKSIHILLVEDNVGDIMLTLDTFEEGKFANKVSVVKDGKEAIDFLNQVGNYSKSGVPDLVLLDINLPKKNGHEVLQEIRNNENIKQTPVIMLTTSSSTSDIEKADKNLANGYLIKPFEIKDFMKILSKIENLWLNIVKLTKKKN